MSYPLRFALPSVALGSAPLRGHRMTFGHSSKALFAPCLRGTVWCGWAVIGVFRVIGVI